MKLTPKELIAMAREAGFPVSWTQGHSDGDEILTRFASIVSARTREECAQKCDDMVLYTGFDCAAAIRAMGERT